MQPISCEAHDYIEIACIYRVMLEIRFRDGGCVKGRAKTTCYNERKEECLEIESASGSQLLVLSDLASMQAVDNTTHFDEVRFIT